MGLNVFVIVDMFSDDVDDGHRPSNQSVIWIKEKQLRRIDPLSPNEYHPTERNSLIFMLQNFRSISMGWGKSSWALLLFHIYPSTTGWAENWADVRTSNPLSVGGPWTRSCATESPWGFPCQPSSTRPSLLDGAFKSVTPRSCSESSEPSWKLLLQRVGNQVLSAQSWRG